MADNIPLPNTALNVATDEVAGVHYPRTKITLGNDGVNGGDVSSTNPMPVTLDATSLLALENINVTVDNLTVGLTDAQLRATPVGVTVSNPVTSVSVSNFTDNGLTDAQLRATPVPVSGTVTANTGLTQPLTDTQLRAAAVPVSGTVTISNPVSSVSVSNFPATQIISGTVTANTGLTQPLTDTQLRASAVPVSIASVPVHDVNIKSSGGANIVTDGNGNLTVAGSVIDGSAPGTRIHLMGGTDGTVGKTLRLDTSGRVIVAGNSANGGAVGSANPLLVAGSDGTTTRNISTDATGKVNVVVTSAPTTAVTGTFWQATQPVSGPLTDTQLRATAVPISGTVTANTGLTQPLTDTQLRASAVPVSIASVPSHAVTNAGTFAVQVTSAPTTAVTGTFWQATQPVSGPLTDTQLRATAVPVSVSSVPLPTGAATEATQATLSTEVTLLALKALQEEIKAQTEVVEYALMAMLDKMAIPDRYDRMRISLSGSDGSEANGAYYGLNVASVGDNVNGRLYSRVSEPWNFSDMGSTRIYNNIIVS